MGVLKKFEQRLEGLVNGTFAEGVQVRGTARGDRGSAPARVRQQRDHLEPRPHRRAQRLHRGVEHTGLRAPQPLLGPARRRTGRHGARLRQAAALHLHGTDQGPPGEGRRPRHRPVPGAQPHAQPPPPDQPGRPGPRGAPGPAARPARPGRRGTATRRPQPRGRPPHAVRAATRRPSRRLRLPAARAAASGPGAPLLHRGGRTRRWIEINGTRHQISRATLVLGRSTEADVRIDDPGVSRRHCEIRTGTPSTIQDLGSTNGIVVDGQHTPALRSATARGSSWAAPPLSTGKPKGDPRAMSELTLTVMRLGFLAVLWLFVIVAVQVIRSDLFGTRVTQRGARARAPPGRSRPPRARARRPAAAPAVRRRPPRPQRAQQAGRHARAPSPAPPLPSRARPSRWAGRTTRRSCWTTTTPPAGTPGSTRTGTASGSSRTSGSTNGTYLDRTRLTTPTPIGRRRADPHRQDRHRAAEVVLHQ